MFTINRMRYYNKTVPGIYTWRAFSISQRLDFEGFVEDAFIERDRALDKREYLMIVNDIFFKFA